MLISVEDFGKYNIDIPSSINKSKLNRAIKEAEDIDLSAYFNEAFMLDLKTNYNTDANKALINGTTYTYSTETKKFEGLKAVLVYFAYARLLAFMDINISANSIVNKLSDFSTPTPDKRTAAAIGTAENNAKFYLAGVVQYIELYSTTYPKYWTKTSKHSKYKVYNNGDD